MACIRRKHFSISFFLTIPNHFQRKNILYPLVTRQTKAQKTVLGFTKEAKVIIKKKIELEKAFLLQTRDPPARRITIAIENSEQILEDLSAPEPNNVPLIDLSSRRILTKPKSASFHVRGRRKSLNVSTSL